jgi:hypothetical protein
MRSGGLYDPLYPPERARQRGLSSARFGESLDAVFNLTSPPYSTTILTCIHG